MMETKDKTALVTGAASGMGAAAARMFAQAGYSVMLADMNGTAVEAAVQGLAASGYEADYTVCDVTDEAQVKAMVEKTVARFGKLDAAYNNAGIMPARVETADTETEAFDHVIAVNLKGVWLCMKYELLQMRRQGHGAIVNSSRGIMCAWKKTGHNGEDYQQAARDAAIAMREDICRFITIQ